MEDSDRYSESPPDGGYPFPHHPPWLPHRTGHGDPFPQIQSASTADGYEGGGPIRDIFRYSQILGHPGLRPLLQQPRGIQHRPLGATPTPKVLGTPLYGGKRFWIIWYPFQGPYWCDIEKPDLPHDIQCVSRCGPTYLGLSGSRGGRGCSTRGIWKVLPASGGIFLS